MSQAHGPKDWISPEEAKKLGIDDASSTLKAEASKQPVTITLTAEQLESLQKQWDNVDNSRPTEISFEVEGQLVSRMAVASYGYFSGDCCARDEKSS